MQVLFKSRDPQDTELRDLTEHRVRFVLRRLGWMLPRAEVQMSDVNDPRHTLQSDRPAPKPHPRLDPQPRHQTDAQHRHRGDRPALGAQVS